MAQRRIEQGDSNMEAIRLYYESEGAIVLDDMQLELEKRWVFADEMIRTWKGIQKKKELASIIMARFEVSRATAYNDIKNAELLFSSSTPLNKKYAIQIQIEALEADIHVCRCNGDYDTVANLSKVLQKYIEMYPDDTRPQGSRNVVYNIDMRSVQPSTMPTEDAEAIINNPALNLIGDE